MKKRNVFLATLLAATLLAGCAPAAPAPSDSAQATPEGFVWKVAWADRSGEYDQLFDCLNRPKMLISSVCHLPIWKIESTRELKEFETRHGDTLTMDQGWDEAPAFSDMVVGYDDRFFRENVLLLVYVEASSSGYRFGVDSVFCEGEELCVHAIQTNFPESFDTMMAGWLIAVETPRSRIDGVTDFDADLIENSR